MLHFQLILKMLIIVFILRHVNIIRSLDGGATWSELIDITPHDIWNGQQECVFASMVKDINDDKIQFNLSEGL